MARFRFRPGRDLPIAVAGCAVVALCAVFAGGWSADEEELRYAVLSAWLRARGPWNLDAAFWTPLLGLGVPQPFVPSFAYHPFAPLLAWMSVVAWARLVLIAYAVAGAIGMWRLGTVLQLPAIVRATGVLTFLYSAPVQNYVLIDFWPTSYVAWTVLPWFTLMTWRLIEPETSGATTRRLAGWLGLIAGVTAASANPAYFPTFVPFAVAMLCRRPRATVRRLAWIATVLLVAAAVAAPVITQLVEESRYFGSSLDWGNLRDRARPLSLTDIWIAFGHPFIPEPSMRTLFFGGPYTVLSLAGCVWLARRHADLALGFVASAILLFTSSISIPLVSSRYQFRDPLTFCGILLAGLILREMMKRRIGRLAATIAISAQVIVMGYSAWLVSAANLAAERTLIPRGALAQTALVDTLVRHMTPGSRVLYSPRLTHAVAERDLVVDGLGVNALAYRGIATVNGMFKGVSTDAVWPDYWRFYGRIDTSQVLLESERSLDVLAIRYVLAYRDDVVAADLRPLTAVRTSEPRPDIVLYENRDAWPTAFLVRSQFGAGEVPVIEGCGHQHLFCRDLGFVVPHRDPRRLRVTREPDRIRITIEERPETAVLVVSEMFRPGWEAFSDRARVTTRSVFGGLIGVSLPAGVREVTLYYRPQTLRIAWFIRVAALMVAIGLIAIPVRR